MKKTFVAIALLATACHHIQPTVSVTGKTSDDRSSDAAYIPDPVTTYHPAETVLTDLLHTRLEVSFDWKNSRLTGRETLTAKPHFYSSDSLILDAKGMDIKSVQINGSNLLFSYDGDLLKIKLDKTYTRSEEYTVVIDYIAKPEERVTGGSSAITSDKGLYFINPSGADPYKMPQIWTQGETESNSVWFPTIDSPNTKTKQEMFITVEDKYITLSNGKLIDSKHNPDGTRTDHWKQDLPHAPYLFMMGVGEFKVVKDQWKRPDGTLMDVNYYVEPEWEPYARAIFGETPDMIGFFSQLLGVDYPWDKYNQMVVRDYVSGAMENTGAVIFGDFAYKTDRELLDDNDNSTIAHELFHHWFGDLVTCESWSNLPLNESFANYSQYLWDEHRYGLDEADYNAQIEMEGYFRSAAASGYHDLIWFDYGDKEAMFDGHSYNKGGRILHMLRNYLGDEAFFEGLKRYLKTNSWQPAEFHNLRLAFESVSGEDLNWFFNQWFLESGHPELQVDYAQTINSITVHVKQKQDLTKFPVFRLPVDVAVYDDKGTHINRIVIDKADQTFTLPVSGKLLNVVFDQQAMLLGTIEDNKLPEWNSYQYYHSTRWKHRRNALNTAVNQKTPEAMQLISDAMNDPFHAIRRTAIEKVTLLKDAYRTAAIEKLKMRVSTDSISAVRVSAVNALSTALSNEEVQPILEKCIREDQSYNVIIAALTQLSKFNSPLAAQLAATLENEPSSKMLQGIANLYAKIGSADNFAFYERILTTNAVQGYDATTSLSAFIGYLGNQDLPLFRKAVKVIEYQAKNGNMYTTMYFPGSMRFLNSKLKEKILAYEEDERKAKQNGNENFAEMARAKKTEAEALIKTFESLSESVQRQNSGEGH